MVGDAEDSRSTGSAALDYGNSTDSSDPVAADPTPGNALTVETTDDHNESDDDHNESDEVGPADASSSPPPDDHRRQRQARALLVAFNAFAVATVARIAWAPGWPRSHDISAALGETEIYVAHLRRWDLFPLWSTNDANGFGSPAPFYYHKVYAYLSASFRLVGLSPKAALAASLIVLLGLGLWLTTRCLSLLVDDPRLSVLLAGTYVFSTYIMSDVLIRASMAEFAWTMFLPWFIGLWIVLIRDRFWSWQLVPAFLLLFFSHSAVTLATTAILIVASVPSLVADRFDLISRTLPRIAVSATVVGIAIAPYLLIYRQFSNAFSPSAVINDNGWVPAQNFMSLPDFFVTPTWFGPPYVVNVGQLALVPIAGVALYLLARPRRPLKFTAFVASLAIAAVLPTFMQTRLSAPIYDLSVFRILQFPWRLVALSTLAILVAAAAIIGPSRRPHLVVAALSATTAITLISSPLFASTGAHHEQYELAGMLDSSIDGELAYAREYLPRVRSGDDSTGTRTARLAADLAADYGLQGACTLEVEPWEFESGQRGFATDCAETGTVVLPLYTSPMHRVTIDGEQTQPLSVTDDPRLHLAVPAGAARISVELP